VLVVGIGNPLRGDDGVGPGVAARLAALLEARGALVLEVHQLLPELAEDVACASQVVLVDAVAGRAPGSVRVEELLTGTAAGAGGVREALAGGAFSHGFGCAGLLALAGALYGSAPAARLVGVGIAGTEPGAALSPEVRRALPRAAQAVLEAIEEMRRAPEPVPAAPRDPSPAAPPEPSPATPREPSRA
jgi:hydrogenase maturation protease